MIRLIALFCLGASLLGARAGTLMTLNTTVGKMEFELYDDDKPITVANFLKYVDRGLFKDSFIQRWEPNFVIQMGQWYVSNRTSNAEIAPIPTFGSIPNEYSVGRPFSNTYGTLAMARVGGQTNSASSQWFANLKDNSFLDGVDGGFTVFGHLTSGSEVLNLFIPDPPQKGIYRYAYSQTFSPPLTSPTFNASSLVYLDFALRRDVNLRLQVLRGGNRRVTWLSVSNQVNFLETSTNTPPVWREMTNFIGTGASVEVFDRAPRTPGQLYRVRIYY